MSDYNPTVWNTGDVITATKLNNAETGIDTAHDEIDELEIRRIMSY